MKFNILSDLHLDFYFTGWVEDAQIRGVFDGWLDPSESIEVLCVAGDISHENHHAELLYRIADLYNYKRVFCVLGNHDLYTNKKYTDSRKRQADWYGRSNEVVKFLDGNIEEYGGVKFGGAMSWYDGTYNAPQAYAYKDPIKIWKHTMNDAYYISGYEDFYEILQQEMPKVKSILGADVILTHVCPLSHSKAFQTYYKSELSSMFYAFDGESLLHETNAEHWVFGHSHGFHEFEVFGTTCTMNAMGYPNEGHKKRVVELEVK